MNIDKLKKSLSSETPNLAVEQQILRDAVTGYLYGILDSAGITQKALSRRMGISPAAVSKLLSGDHSRNFTLDKMTEIAFHLGQVPVINFRPLKAKDRAILPVN